MSFREYINLYGKVIVVDHKEFNVGDIIGLVNDYDMDEIINHPFVVTRIATLEEYIAQMKLANVRLDNKEDCKNYYFYEITTD